MTACTEPNKPMIGPYEYPPDTLHSSQILRDLTGLYLEQSKSDEYFWLVLNEVTYMSCNISKDKVTFRLIYYNYENDHEYTDCPVALIESIDNLLINLCFNKELVLESFDPMYFNILKAIVPKTAELILAHVN